MAKRCGESNQSRVVTSLTKLITKNKPVCDNGSRAVLKTVVLKGIGGSSPSAGAT